MNRPTLDRRKKKGEVWKADFHAMLGDRLTNRFMACCDLGVEGVFQPHTVTITWKKDSVLTTRRAAKLCEKIKDGFNKTDSGIDCASVHFLRIYKE